jgi:hypothetical protein
MWLLLGSTRVENLSRSCRVARWSREKFDAVAPATACPGQRAKEAHGEFDSECPGYCGAQDTFYVGTFKGVGLRAARFIARSAMRRA